MTNPFRYLKTSPEIIGLAGMMYVRVPLSRCNVEVLLHRRGIGISHETVRRWWDRFGPLMAREIGKRRSRQMQSLHKGVGARAFVDHHLTRNRFLERRPRSKDLRNAALAEWRRLLAA